MGFNILQLIFGQIPEAVYFALFMIFAKQLKEKRISFIILMILEYILLKQFIKFNIWFQISYTFLTFIILKMLYKQKSQITDIFIFCIASILLILIDIPLYFIITAITSNYIIFVIFEKITMFLVLFLLKNKLPKIQNIYKKLWNRNDKNKKKIKTTTFRSINIFIFNISFYIINIALLYCIYRNSIM